MFLPSEIRMARLELDAVLRLVESLSAMDSKFGGVF
jgi:hypothetical protein